MSTIFARMTLIINFDRDPAPVPHHIRHVGVSKNPLEQKKLVQCITACKPRSLQRICITYLTEPISVLFVRAEGTVAEPPGLQASTHCSSRSSITRSASTARCLSLSARSASASVRNRMTVLRSATSTVGRISPLARSRRGVFTASWTLRKDKGTNEGEREREIELRGC